MKISQERKTFSLTFFAKIPKVCAKTIGTLCGDTWITIVIFNQLKFFLRECVLTVIRIIFRWRRKFPVSWKNDVFCYFFYVIVLSILRGSRISNSWISCFNWRGTLSTDDGICTTLKTSDLYVAFQSSFTFFCFRFRGKSSTGHHWVGIRGVLIKINWMIYTYLNSAKHEDSGYTSH